MLSSRRSAIFYFFFFNDTATTEIYTLSLHDALPISRDRGRWRRGSAPARQPQRSRSRRSFSSFHLYSCEQHVARRIGADRKSTRLNSSHSQISYAVFCLKKKNET